MSVAAIAWAFQQKLDRPSLKLLLVAMADYAGHQGIVFPSVKALVLKTSLDRKTVIDGLQELQRIGLMSDTHERVGRTKQVKVYQLPIEQSQFRNSSEKGTVPLSDGKGPENGTGKESQKRDTESSILEPLKEPKKGIAVNSPKTGTVQEQALDAYRALIASDGAQRGDRVQRALDAVGGWQRVRMRTPHDEHFLIRDFCDAFRRG